MRTFGFWKILLVTVILIFGLILAQWLSASPNPPIPASGVATPSVTFEENLQPAPTWTATFVGDIMLDRHVRTVIERSGPSFPFETIRDQLTGDLVIGNLEGPLTNNRSVATDTHLVFTFDPALAETLRQVGFTHLSLANNHTLNFGQVGLDQTRQILMNRPIPFGDPRNTTGFSVDTVINRQPVALIGYHGLVSGRDSVIAEIRRAEEFGQFVIVMPHWGTEYNLKFTSRQQQDAHALIEAGADLIIGAHPHVVEPLEIYQGKLIAYSLGNFLFDQYFSEDTQQGLILRIIVQPHSLAVELLPIRTINRQIQLLTDARRDTLLERLARDSSVPEELRASIRQGYLTLTQ